MILKTLERLDRLDYFINAKRTGTAEEFAQKLGISRRQLYNHFDELKDLGLEVEFDRYARTYRYKSNARLKISVKVEPLSQLDSLSVNGGELFFANLPTVQFYCTLPA